MKQESTIVIDPVTRIEGHSKITLHLNEDGRVEDARFHVTQFRGFEKLCEGRPFYEMPSLMARICGICPVSHLIASAKACDSLLAVRIPPTADKLRRIFGLAQVTQSHALSLFHLSSPDLLLGMDADPAKSNIFGVAEANTELALDGIRLRQFGQKIIERLGGKRIHPAWVVPGGVSEPLSEANRDAILQSLPEALAIAERTLEWFKGTMERFREEISTFGNFPTLFMGIVKKDNGLTFYDGKLRIVDASGHVVADDLDPTQYDDYIGEKVEPWSYLKSAYYKPKGFPDGIYRVGPLARLNVADRCGTPRADQELGRISRTAAHRRAQLVPLSPRAADRDSVLHRAAGAAAERSRDSLEARARRGPAECARRRRRVRSAAGHAFPSLQDRRARIDPLGEPDHRHRPQQSGHEPQRAAGRQTLRARSHA